MNTEPPSLLHFLFLLMLVGLVVFGVAVGVMGLAELVARWW